MMLSADWKICYTGEEKNRRTGGHVMFGPNPDAVHPNEQIPSVCYIKNVITRPNIEVGVYLL